MNYKRLQKKRFNILFLGVFAIIASLFFYFLPERIYLGIRNITLPEISFDDNTNTNLKYDGDPIVAPSYIIYDNTNKKVVLENDNKPMALASVTKLMTALIAMRYCKDNIQIKEQIITKQKAVEEMLVESSNEIAEAIANVCPNTEDFVASMNRVAQDMRTNMSFKNPSGLDENNETEGSAFGTPRDVAELINNLYLEYPKVLESTSYSVWEGVRNTNNYASNWPFLLGSKTGYTDVAHGNLAIIFEPIPNKRVSIVVLGSTKEDRFKDVYRLMNWYLKKQ